MESKFLLYQSVRKCVDPDRLTAASIHVGIKSDNTFYQIRLLVLSEFVSYFRCLLIVN